MKKFLLMLFLFFLCGIISADLCIEELKLGNVMLDIDTYRAYAHAELTFKDVFWNICYERIKLVLLCVLLSMTSMRGKIGFVFICMFSFIWGYFLMGCISVLGIAGVVVGIGSVIPHGIIYGSMLVIMFYEKKTYTYKRREKLVVNTTSYVLMCLLFLTACIIESLMGTHVIPWVIRLGLI